MNKGVLITGSGGVIGSVLQAGLPHEITEFDLPYSSVSDLHGLLKKAQGHHTLIHLAWDGREDNWLTEYFDTDNTQNTYNVYEAAHQAGVKRVIMASSVHADRFINREETPLKPYSLPLPDSPYGVNKCFTEAMGRYYADAKGLEVVCVRFGGVNKDNTPPKTTRSERQVWLSHADCVDLVTTIINAESIPGKFAIVYAISNNQDMLHDISNPFGWHPKDSA